MTIESLRAAIDDRIGWAIRRLVAAQEDGDTDGIEAWHGYIQGLRWVLAMIDHPAIIGPSTPEEIGTCPTS